MTHQNKSHLICNTPKVTRYQSLFSFPIGQYNLVWNTEWAGSDSLFDRKRAQISQDSILHGPQRRCSEPDSDSNSLSKDRDFQWGIDIASF